MAVTHFKISKLPNANLVTSKIGVSTLQEDFLYDIALQGNLTFERKPSLDGFFVSEKVFYKTYDQVLDKYSNESAMYLIWKEKDLNIAPASADVVKQSLNQDILNMLEEIPFNSPTEYIEIVSYSGVNNLLLNGNVLSIGQRISPAEMLELKYSILNEGGGSPYFSLTYKVGKGKITQNQEYTFIVNVDSLAEISIGSQTSVTVQETFDIDGVPTEYPLIFETVILDIKKGYQSGTAELNFVINSPFLTASNINAQSSIVIEINGIEIEKTANETFSLVADLNDSGFAQVKITNEIVKDDANETGQIDVTLSSINQDPLLVSATSSVSVITNF